MCFSKTLCLPESIGTAAVPAVCKDREGEKDTLPARSLKHKMTRGKPALLLQRGGPEQHSNVFVFPA